MSKTPPKNSIIKIQQADEVKNQKLAQRSKPSKELLKTL